MAAERPPLDDLDSDSDSDSDCSVTQTQLAVSDGPLEGDDESNPLVSRIGGHVAWLPTRTIPPDSVARCAHCGQLMELLVQIFAPLDDSPYDRIVLVWGCARAPCQKRGTGCLKAVRILSHNARWAAKLERKRRRGERKAAHLKKLEEDRIAREEEEEKRRKVNPFASKSSGIMTGGLGGALFGGDANPFGATAVPAPAMTTTDDVEEDEIARPEDKSDESDNEDDQAEQMAEELAIKASLETKQTDWADRDWSRSAPAYEPAQYLTTFAEPSSSVQSNEEQKRNKAQMQKLKQNGIQEVKGWEAEKYESMMAAGVDDVFQRFLKRVSQHGKQLVRYEFGGTPLPFHAKGKAYDTLWPKQKRKGATIVTGQAFSANGEGAKDERDYTTENVARCLRCGSRRVFEMQLMPNLINTLRPKLIKGGSDGDESAVQDAEAERRREIEEALGHRLPVQPDADGITRDSKADQPAAEEAKVARRTGLRWNTAMVFVCEADCHDEQAAGMTQSWSEEVVELQTEHEQ